MPVDWQQGWRDEQWRCSTVAEMKPRVPSRVRDALLAGMVVLDFDLNAFMDRNSLPRLEAKVYGMMELTIGHPEGVASATGIMTR